MNENEEGVSFFGEQKKFVLKTPKPAAEEMPAPVEATPMAPPPVPSPELPPSPVGDEAPEVGGEEAPVADDMGMDVGVEDVAGEMGGDEMEKEDEKVTFKTIQKLTGKLTQKIRTLDNEEGMTSENIKYVINMVLSSLDLKNLSEEDKEDIMNKFEEAEEREEGPEVGGEEEISADIESPEGDVEMGAEVPVESEVKETPSYGAIMDHIFGESKVDKVISKYFEITKKEILENREKQAQKTIQKISEVKRQMKEVVKLTESIEQELASKKFLEENKEAKIVGKTNKKNLVFENKGKQVKISPEGLLV